MAGILNRTDLDSTLWFAAYVLCDFKQIGTPLLQFFVDHRHIPQASVCMNWLNWTLSLADAA